MLTFFRTASEAFYGTATSPGLLTFQQHLLDAPASPTGSPSNSGEFNPTPQQNPLLSKQAIIVLREELEYFTIPPKSDEAVTDANGLANETLLAVKRDGGEYLMDKRNIFTALQRNVNKENNVAEQHLIDMLCMRCVPLTMLSFYRSCRAQRLRPRRRVGFPRARAFTVVHLLHRARPS